jgi:hypothetical protein
LLVLCLAPRLAEASGVVAQFALVDTVPQGVRVLSENVLVEGVEPFGVRAAICHWID